MSKEISSWDEEVLLRIFKRAKDKANKQLISLEKFGKISRAVKGRLDKIKEISEEKKEK